MQQSLLCTYSHRSLTDWFKCCISSNTLILKHVRQICFCVVVYCKVEATLPTTDEVKMKHEVKQGRVSGGWVVKESVFPPEYQCYIYCSYCLTLYNRYDIVSDVDRYDIGTIWWCDEIYGFLYATDIIKYAILGGVGYPK